MHPLAIPLQNSNILHMRNIISILIGLFALLLVIPAFIPLLGWANWIIIPIAVVGLAIGATSDRTAGRNLNIVVILVGVGRLMLGGGII
jgi:protein-S-isoprenylcysteine O-methyltransferase Ste14